VNLRRGFFRIWIVLSVLWVIGVSIASYDEVVRAFTAAKDLTRSGDWMGDVGLSWKTARLM
jgi:hypothetical protein